MNIQQKFHTILKERATIAPDRHDYFFKTGKGDYAEHDRFLGVTVPTIRATAKEHADLSLPEIAEILSSPYNEARLLGLIILVNQYTKGSPEKKELLYRFYLKKSHAVNNWNLVDLSAHWIVGGHILSGQTDADILYELAQSDDLWERRIAIVATWLLIRKQQLDHTFALAEKLLNDEHDLMHKAVGWMLREAGKKDENRLKNFLDKHAAHMPRTMLRYAIEKFPKEVRQQYMRFGK